MKIGILVCGHNREQFREAHGDYPDMFIDLLDGHGFEFEVYDVEGMKFPSGIHACDGWLLTGSRHGVYEDHPFIAPLESFVQDANAADIPLVGICFGHQLIAQALGGTVEKYALGWAIGSQDYEFQGHGTLTINAWHQDQVIRPPNGAKTIAKNAFCAHAGFAIGATTLTMQPHPEISGALIREFVLKWKGTRDYPDDAMERAAALASMPTDSDKAAQMIARFFLTAKATTDA